MAKVQIFQDEGYEAIEFIGGKYPVFRLRGKKVTPEQAFEIISRTDSVIGDLLPKDIKLAKRFLPDLYVVLETNYFDILQKGNNTYEYPFGWCHPNGVIGINSTAGRMPYDDEILPELEDIVSEFPFLDFIIAITDWDGEPPYLDALVSGEINKLRTYSDEIEQKNKYFEILNNRDKILGELPLWIKSLKHDYYICYYLEPPDFIEHIITGYYVHDGIIELLNKERAKRIYTEYDLKYSGLNKAQFVTHYYKDRGVLPADYNYLRKCIASYGLDPDKILKGSGIQPTVKMSKTFYINP